MKIPFSNHPKKDLIIAGGFALMLLLLVFSAFWAYKYWVSTPPYVDPVRYPVRGIDISAHNGEIDFKKVKKAGYEFVFIKATEGADFNDRNFLRNYDNARREGLKIGSYHFFRFDTDGIEQALNFVRTVGTRKNDLGLVIDVEKTGNPDSIPPPLVRERLFRMVDYMTLLGHRVTFYTNLEGYNTYIADTFPGYPLWICRFKEYPIYTEWTFWQFNHRGKVDGIEGEVDLNAFCGNREEWEQFLNGAVWPYSAKKQ